MQTFGLIGYPLGHSFSRKFFTEKFLKEHIDAQYLNFEIENLDNLIDILKKNKVQGFNITIPYKQDIFPFLSNISNEAKEIGAVNVVKISYLNNDIQLAGYNSDIYGFVESIRPFLKPHHKRALILGTGGASKAILVGLKQLNIEAQYVSRKPSSTSLSYEEITDELIQGYQIIINCTPLGMHPRIDTAPDIPYKSLNSSHLLYDLVYNPELTSFLKQGQAQGATIKNGLEMLHLQALKAWEIWQD